MRVAEQCDRMGFDGTVWPVHPTRETVAGRRAFRSIDALPGAPDAVFVGVNRHATVDAVAALSRLGAGGAVCYASGFLEAADGGRLQRELVDAAAGMPIIGPNCYGFINFLDATPLWPDQHGGRRLDPAQRGVAIVTQSSNIAISMTMQQRALPVAYLVTAGNQAQLDVSGLALALLDDERVTAIGLHVGGFDSVAGFEALARRARERKVPVAVMKTGRSAKGRVAEFSHTATIAGTDAGSQAFLRRLGFARADGIPEFMETLKLLHVHGALDGARLGCDELFRRRGERARRRGGKRRGDVSRPRTGPCRCDRGDGSSAGHRVQPVRLSHLQLGQRGRADRDLHRFRARAFRRDAAGARLSARGPLRRHRLADGARRLRGGHGRDGLERASS